MALHVSRVNTQIFSNITCRQLRLSTGYLLNNTDQHATRSNTSVLTRRHVTQDGGSTTSMDLKPYTDIPGPDPFIFNLAYYWKDLRLFIQKPWEFFDMRFKQYPSGMFREKLVKFKLLHISKPEIIQEFHKHEDKFPIRMNLAAFKDYHKDAGEQPGVLPLDGEEWHRVRRAINPLMMRPKHLLEYTDILQDVTMDFVNKIWNLQQQLGPDTPIPNIDNELYYWALESTGGILYESRFGAFSGNMDPRIQEYVNAIPNVVDQLMILTFVPYRAAKYIFPRTYKKFNHGMDTFKRVGYEILKDKMEEMSKKLEAGEQPRGFLYNLLSNESLSHSEVNANTLDLMGAAVDTTSNTMQWILYSLSKHPEVQQQLFEEVADMYSASGTLDKSNVQHMHYTKAVIKESMRLNPTTLYYTRLTTKDIALCGFRIPADTLVAINNYASGRDPEHFPEPLEFRPGRWLRDSDMPPNLYGSLSFGFGVRMCIGRRVAELELQLLIAHLVQKFHILPGDPTPLERLPGFVIKPHKPVSIILKPRK